MKAPLFSILHTSARPDKWRAVYDDWMAKCVRPEDVEYVLVIDYRWGFSEDGEAYDTPRDNVRVVVNNRRRCYVDGVNLAAEASTGAVLIVNADDQFACEQWDSELIRHGALLADQEDGTQFFVIEVSTGTPNEHERGVMVMPILSRARYEQQGYVFYLEYESMFADNDFCEAARQDGVVIDARHLMFPHRHPLFDQQSLTGWSTDWRGRADIALLAQNRPEAQQLGKEVYARRKASGFPPMQHGIVKRTLALCLPGGSNDGEPYSSKQKMGTRRGSGMKAPLFSILHTSARPDKWRAVYDDWMSKCVRPEDVEYVLVIDPRWKFDIEDMSKYDTPFDNVHVVLNNRRRCYVDGVNLAAEASTGQILIVNADDQFACDGWDAALGLRVCNLPWTGAWVIEVSTGTPNEHERGVMVMPILSRARYQQQGYVFYIEYESLFADNDFCETARQDGVVIDARHLMFPHRHPMFDSESRDGWSEDWKGRADIALRAQNRPEAYELGKRVYSMRKASGFPPMQHGIVKRTLALCLPGEQFQGVWVGAMLSLQAHLLLNHPEFQVVVLQQYTSNPYITRDDIRRALAGMNLRSDDLCLWLDDDNVLSVEHFEQLLKGLDAHSEVDGVSAWCWIHSPFKTGFVPSVGFWGPDHLHWDPMPPEFAHRQGLEPFECGGLPCILMRYSALEKAGDGAFLPVLDSRLEHGVLGEDFAFFLSAEKGGATFLVDPQVRIPHLKYVTVEPVFSQDGWVPVKVACMMRVKNEGRWIQHTIDSVRELCGDFIFVMEDGSTDDTRAICEAAGVVVFDSPFIGQGLDEARDKDWLLHEVIERCHPDWILMPDGDEELQAGGCAKIRRALEANPPCDCFALKFLYFWDGIDQIRVDGVYGQLQRQSLFRADSSFRFKSYYSEGETANQNHVGLHTSNAPGLGGVVRPLNVALLHYGYLHREDRIRKFAWIVGIDPTNEGEGYYLHCVQGDLPEVPAEAVLKHAGPLQLSKLPAHLIPKFEPVPGPVETSGPYLYMHHQAREYAALMMESRAELSAAD